MKLAQEAGMDLVEVAPTERPPVCRIMDYGKWKYTQKKKKQKGKHGHEVQIKEVRIRPKTDPHDKAIKVNRAIRFLGDGNKVQFTMLFRGRERFHVTIGMDILNGIAADLEPQAKVERFPKMEGRRMTMLLAPNKGGPAKPKPPKTKTKTAPVAPPQTPAPAAATPPTSAPAVAPASSPAPASAPAPSPAPAAAPSPAPTPSPAPAATPSPAPVSAPAPTPSPAPAPAPAPPPTPPDSAAQAEA